MYFSTYFLNPINDSSLCSAINNFYCINYHTTAPYPYPKRGLSEKSTHTSKRGLVTCQAPTTPPANWGSQWTAELTATGRCTEPSWPWAKADTALRTAEGGWHKRLIEKPCCECKPLEKHLCHCRTVLKHLCHCRAMFWRHTHLQDTSVHSPLVSEDATQHLMDFSARILAAFVPLISWCSLLWGTRGTSGVPLVHLDTHTSPWQGKSNTGKLHFE